MSEPIDTNDTRATDASDAPPKNPAAVALGRLGKGRPKTISDEERERRRASARAMGRKRWAVKGEVMREDETTTQETMTKETI